MKKIYQKPVIEFENMELDEMMTKASIPIGDPVGSAVGAEGRCGRFSTWDEDDE